MSIELDDVFVAAMPRSALVEALRERKNSLKRHAETLPNAAKELGHEELAREQCAKLQTEAGDLAITLEHIEGLPEGVVVRLNLKRLLQLVAPADLRRYAEQDLVEQKRHTA